MKIKLLIVTACLFVSAIAFSQTLKKTGSFGFGFAFSDFNTPAEIKATSLGDVLDQGDWLTIRGRMNPSFNLQYWKGLTSHLDISGTYTGIFLENMPSAFNNQDADYFQSLDVSVNAKLLKETAVVNPFLTAGIGGYHYKNNSGAQMPLGLGIQFNPFDGASLLIQSIYKLNLSEAYTDHIVYSFGILLALSTPETVAPPPPPAPVAAAAVILAPADTDKDGVIDSLDKCPSDAGIAKYNGCQIPDTDGDAINDELDKCITVAGYARYEGCPVTDTDSDGVNDEEDKCPKEAGPASNAGCPAFEQYNFNANNVQFAAGSAILTSVAKAELDKGVTILNDHPDIKIAIKGYTDNTGNAASNKALSQKRADAVKAYMVKKGISAERLTATGFGMEDPLTDNKTADGRAKNRRVEFKTMH